MTRAVLLAFDVDGTLIDTRRSFNAAVKILSGVTDDDALELFRSTGGFNDDWELARALSAWQRAGRPKIVERCQTLEDVLLWCGAQNDPGDLSARGTALYRGEGATPGLWRSEALIVDGASLEALSELYDVVACTGRDRWEFARAEELLGYSFARATTMESAKKPDPRALLRLIDDDSAPPDVVVLVGDTHADRLTVSHARRERPSQRFAFIHVDHERTVRPFIELALAGDVDEGLRRFAEP